MFLCKSGLHNVSIHFIIYIRLPVQRDAHGFFMYTLLRYTCPTCFVCYLHPSSGAQTAEYSRRYTWLLRCVGSWVVHWSRLRLGQPHTAQTISNSEMYRIYVYIYIAPCKARNFNVVYIWTYVLQRWKPSLSICCTMRGRCVGLATLPPSCADWLEIWEPQPPGTPRACPSL
jgi:hypothetical protein